MKLSPYRVGPSLSPSPRAFPFWVTCAAVGIWTLSSCVSACGSLSNGGGGPNVVVPGVNFAVCVLTNSALDISKGMTPIQVTADLIAKCGGDLLTIATVLDADARARESGGTAKAFAEIAASAHAQASDAGGR